MRVIGIALAVLLSAACTKLNREMQNVKTETAAAQEELSRTLGQPVGLQVQDSLVGDQHAVSVEVLLNSKPEGLTPAEVERSATLIVRKHIVHVTNVVVRTRE